MGTTTLPRNAYIYCEVCQGEYSATPGDYWNVDKAHIFECCEVPSMLVQRRGRFTGDGIILETVTVGDLS